MKATEHTYEVLIIGTGFGGQSAALQLKKRGIDDFVMLERRDFMGGTWCQNSYPGAQVDVQSPLYSLASEPYPWSQMFAEQPELEAYTHHVLTKHELANKVRLRRTVTELRWLAERCCWQVTTDHEVYFARSVISAQGPLSNPLIPDFANQDAYQGKTFHTNQWDHGFAYSNKRVAIIGSGASAAQVIPAIADKVAQLHVFQRTPHWVMPRPDRRFPAWFQRLLGVNLFYQTLRKAIYWGLEWRVLAFKYSKTLMKLFAEREARKHLREQIPDPELREKLTPDYMIGCKRIIVSNTLYPALARENVTLHDKNDGIARFTEQGIITTQGTELELDLVVYSTGFKATDGALGFDVIGRDGKRLDEVWEDYPRAYLGTTMPGFPNLFLVTGPNTGIGHTSAIFVIESQMYYIMRALTELRRRHQRVIEVTEEAEQAYTDMIHREMAKTVWQSGGCESWYKSKSGKVTAMFPGFSFVYRLLAQRFRAKHHQFSNGERA
ncbi:NAD(P)/FAD-dependent oxidoreductase [Pseudidiomarina sp. 1APP75-32.1]|uniref:NAD(P)/FAD-dependent oxidoreductase n=1 Tax=Pseudidiomarina terrestris TaxID=2820060 RepID=A0AAW7R179_9GAMM|nr:MULTISPECIES: NAD(P)/FAD-dependent oxidoreductase [unclassified Pseudidiomarina]MDN7124905.1 NAD(P)/FAD-dependent oxidoreductase [Pseudidiomarina sp. 1APP75-32.1]MDN7129622.1 NAD(P)/FAD-dependent oxidoreductase [Pseudidiomarina sp. 1APR75-15]MDN7138125.1 NAD(P)/FAD-dependent oxidoreductase [Pseudidiomarina sp. 1ASP75-14]